MPMLRRLSRLGTAMVGLLGLSGVQLVIAAACTGSGSVGSAT